tara:strand:- start:9735 stop:10622 length:888 start_codon:yes stop_codon:yes gene_type:complete
MNQKHCEFSAKHSGLNQSEIEKLYEISKLAALEGGKILMKNYGKIRKISNKSNIGDLVTNADIEAEETIIDFLNSKTPEIPMLAEESGYKGDKKALKWCIDPLDGTTNYAHGFPFFASSIGLTFNDKPFLGSISVPFFNELYSAAPGIGSFCNKQKIEVSICSSLINSLLVTGFAYDRQTSIENNYSEFCLLTNKTRGVRRAGAAAVDLAFVAAGRLDGYWERGLSQWDIAAGVPIVELAGGTVSNYPTGMFDLTSGRILACSPGIENELKLELSKVKPLNLMDIGAKADQNMGS